MLFCKLIYDKDNGTFFHSENIRDNYVQQSPFSGLAAEHKYNKKS